MLPPNHWRYRHVTPTLTLRGLLCGVLGAFFGTLAWLAVAGLAWVLYPGWCLLALARQRLSQPFDEARSFVWCSLMACGAVVAFITVAELWPATQLAFAHLAALASI